MAKWLVLNNGEVLNTIEADDIFAEAYSSSTGYTLEKIPDEVVLEPPKVVTIEDRVTTLESDNKLLKEQNEALSAQMDFYEECMVEMAEIIYA